MNLFFVTQYFEIRTEHSTEQFTKSLDFLVDWDEPYINKLISFII